MSALRKPEPVIVVGLLRAERALLLELLTDLSDADWRRPTCCPGWSVYDVALHLLGDDLGALSRLRDHHLPPRSGRGEGLVPFLNRFNEEWVAAARRLSPRLLVDLLRLSGEQTCGYFASLDPLALGDRVSWAGPEPAPNWLGIAREYSERWVHQQQIREAIGAPLLAEGRWIGPVLATFVCALPVTYATVDAPEGTAVSLVVEGEGGGTWTVARGPSGAWELFVGAAGMPTTTVRMTADLAWRLFTKQVAPVDALPRVTIDGDAGLGRRLLGTVSIVA